MNKNTGGKIPLANKKDLWYNWYFLLTALQPNPGLFSRNYQMNSENVKTTFLLKIIYLSVDSASLQYRLIQGVFLTGTPLKS